MNDNGEKPFMGKDFQKEFDKCPACGKSEPFFGMITDELKERGIVDKAWNFSLDMKSGPVMQPQKEAALPIGAEVPGYSFATDICSNCGCIYVVKLQRVNLKKTLAPTPLALPNRAERRRMEQQGAPPVFNNPF